MARFIMAGPLQAGIFVIFMTFVTALAPPLAVLGNAAIALVTLRSGWQKGVVLAIVASITLGLLFSAQNSLGQGLAIGLLQWLPIVGFAWILFRTVSWSITLQAIMGTIIFGLVIFQILIPDIATYWTSTLTSLFEPLKGKEEFSAIDIKQQIETLAPHMTWLSAASFTVISVVSLLIGRYWQAKLYNPGGFGEEFRAITVGKPAAFVVIALTTAALLSDHVLIQAMLMAGMIVFLFHGLGLAHSLVHAGKIHKGLLFLMYFLMFILPVMILVMLATLAIIDSFADFRSKLDIDKP
ncbi:MAG: Unknown protein [uncultured Thiotrichaceae bacterium]|uniref:DUF2232 domain-containing protein n=1 Tax=uncultured Thiotrichaceae bacterium TaxID=298394 RepID=A0A6S6TGB8_9GAMM|nr:MAG: Unknown protein [uncultured Thiotrichaceae bacterium]